MKRNWFKFVANILVLLFLEVRMFITLLFIPKRKRRYWMEKYHSKMNIETRIAAIVNPKDLKQNGGSGKVIKRNTIYQMSTVLKI